MYVYKNGREIEIPEDANGDVDINQIREALSVPNNRALIQQQPSGENFVLPVRGKVRANPYDHFADAALSKRGSYES